MKRIKFVFRIVMIAFIVYYFIVACVGRFTNPKYTETELFLHTSKFLMLEFKERK